MALFKVSSVCTSIWCSEKLFIYIVKAFITLYLLNVYNYINLGYKYFGFCSLCQADVFLRKRILTLCFILILQWSILKNKRQKNKRHYSCHSESKNTILNILCRWKGFFLPIFFKIKLLLKQLYTLFIKTLWKTFSNWSYVYMFHLPSYTSEITHPMRN